MKLKTWDQQKEMLEATMSPQGAREALFMWSLEVTKREQGHSIAAMVRARVTAWTSFPSILDLAIY